MSERTQSNNCVVEWFRAHVRSILQKTDSASKIEELDKLGHQVEQLQQARGNLFPICMVGQAGVGKSTLINTLISDTEIVVPSGGGTGPLTANALRVVHGDRPYFIVDYHKRDRVNRTRFILEAALARAQGADRSTDVPEQSNEATAQADGDTDDSGKTATDEAIGRARLLVAGAQTAQRDVPYLIDALRWALALKPKHATQLLEEDMPRLASIKRALHHSKEDSLRHFDSENDPQFRHRLREHACGFLAPMIREMTIHWPSQLLHGAMELVDLPGIGVLRDAYAPLTEEYLRNRAKAVMLVVDSRGIRREDAELLKASGFLNRLLHSSSDLASDPVVLIVVAVKIDDVAVENWRNDKALNGTAQKSREQHFSEQVERCRSDIEERLATYLREVWDEDSEGKREVIESILNNLQVHPVSAPQYRLIVSDDLDDDRPFLLDKDATNIPQLRASIIEIANRCAAEQDQRFFEAQGRFFGQLRARLELLGAQRSEERIGEEEISKFRSDLEEFMAGPRREFDSRRGAFRNFLRKTVPAKIEGRIDSASEKARKAIEGDLRKLRLAHWKTLQAAVRREGTFYGSRHINLPRDFALRFEEPIAEVWSRDILVEVRRETREFAEYQSAVVMQVLNWAKTQGIRRSMRLLEALVESVEQNRKQVNAVGREAVNELKGQVREELIKKIEVPIRRKCRQFVSSNKDYGTGVKSRILELFRDLAEEVVEAASGPATDLLVQRFGGVDKEILTAFREHADPLREAAEALIDRQEKSIERESAQILKAVEAALESIPEIEARAA